MPDIDKTMEEFLIPIEDPRKFLEEFAVKLGDAQVDLDPEYAKILSDNFWELI